MQALGGPEMLEEIDVPTRAGSLRRRISFEDGGISNIRAYLNARDAARYSSRPLIIAEHRCRWP